jgi:hypothetical protein
MNITATEVSKTLQLFIYMLLIYIGYKGSCVVAYIQRIIELFEIIVNSTILVPLWSEE